MPETNSQPSSRPQSVHSSHHSATHDHNDENTPLLSSNNNHNVEAQEQAESSSESSHSPAVARLLRLFQPQSKSPPRWSSLLALFLLCIVAVLIMVLGFLAPSKVQEYAVQAAHFEPTSLSIHSFTTTGVTARIQGDFSMRADNVKDDSVRRFGRFGTWIARKVETGQSSVQVTLPDYKDALLGTAEIPSIVADIRNGHTTHIDFLTELTPGNTDAIRHLAKDYIDGKLQELRVSAEASVPVKSGLIHLGRQTVSRAMAFGNDNIPTLPEYKIHKLNFREVQLPDLQRAMVADVSVELGNDYPLDFTIPPLGFAILVDNCHPSQPLIQLADATTPSLSVKPKENLNVSVSGFVRRLPQAFTQACPGSHESPLDILLGGYIHGNNTTVYVRGSDSPSLDTPRWITDLMSDVTVPVPFPGHTFGHLIRNFTLADVHFGLPDPFAEPDSPESNPRISANIKALVALPEEMNFNISVGRVRADADVFYHGSKLGYLDLNKWQKANSSRIDSDNKDEGPLLAVQSAIEKAPLIVTDDDVFTDVLNALLFGGKGVELGIKAEVDVEMETALGQLAVRKIPAEGSVPVKPIKRGGVGSFTPKIGNLQIIDTGKTSLTLTASVNFTNPTEYSATVPFVDIHILTNGTLLGHATAKDIKVVPGVNTNILVTAVWDPQTMGGEEGHHVGVEFLSQYISGYNTTLTLRAHEGTIPAQPSLGRALSKFAVDLPTPNLRGGGEEGEKHFIQDATSQASNRKRTSRRSHTNLSNLRLAPLSRDISPVDGRMASLTSPHTSYIEGKSAPTTPSILGRSSSRRQLGGAGLSRKLSIYDAEYAPVQVTTQGLPRSALRPDAGDHIMPKAKSEAALNPRPTRAALPKLRTPLLHPNSTIYAVKPQDKQNDDDWITRAGLATTSMLRESKGQSWLTSRRSSTSLQLAQSSDDEEDALVSKSAISLQRLHFADDEFSPETPRATSRWGSRFGSRAASARNSRRGSRANLESPDLHRDPSDYFGDAVMEPEMSVRPDFVDPRDHSDDEDPEQEVARLAREASFGFGSLIDRLVGWTLFDVTEDREATDVETETEDETPTLRERVVHTPVVRPASPPRPRQAVAGADRQGNGEDGGWQDAAWLLGVASKVLL
ncbi:hypothetical protein D6D10_00510 [Aureobasidium pullulans]|uniref:DUF3712 domain-containing protein n=1 Tax=Aureobasidium pullulans TaxID=5580 RepID=A0A4S9F9G6_AURPU|nr:hypothetical protein D6D10_00510 [Aureobasidium pullulans]